MKRQKGERGKIMVRGRRKGGGGWGGRGGSGNPWRTRIG